MKDEELILKAVEYCNDIPSRVRDFLSQQPAEAAPKEDKNPFKVGDWIIGVDGSRPLTPSRITFIKDKDFKAFNGVEEEKNVWKGYNGSVYCRLATIDEVEAHLRKVCDENYVGKKVRCLREPEDVFVIEEFDRMGDYDNGDEEFINDVIVYRAKNGTCMVVYENGKWAEILSDKKQLPKTREEFLQFIDAYLNDFSATDEIFLDQYDFED